METLYFDTHAHYDDEQFDPDREQLLEGMPEAGVGLIVNPGCTAESSRKAAALAERWPFVWFAAGIHPEYCAGAGETDLAAVKELLRHEKCVAVGEIGLDYYWEEQAPREKQHRLLRRQLELALETGKPVIIHDREAHGDILSIVREYPGLRGVFHCFSGSPEMARELVKLGWYLGFDGPVTFRNAVKPLAAAKETPLDRLLLETDSPYLSPVPYRGKRNDSRNLPLIAAVLAELKGVTPEALARRTAENGRQLFHIPQAE